jgi:hypothetical protein
MVNDMKTLRACLLYDLSKKEYKGNLCPPAGSIRKTQEGNQMTGIIQAESQQSTSSIFSLVQNSANTAFWASLILP